MLGEGVCWGPKLEASNLTQNNKIARNFSSKMVSWEQQRIALWGMMQQFPWQPQASQENKAGSLSFIEEKGLRPYNQKSSLEETREF